MDTDVHPELINSRSAYVSVSRVSHEAHLYTNNASELATRLAQDVNETSALRLERSQSEQLAVVNSMTSDGPKSFGLGLGL